MARGRGKTKKPRDDDDDGYTRFTEEINNVSYGSNSSLVEGDEMGSKSTLFCFNPEEVMREGSWEMNYHEAAIYLEEGQNNEKFDSHPRRAGDLPAYVLVHNQWYYGLDLIMSVVLLLLALVETPSVNNLQFPVGVHGIIELVALAVIGVELVLKVRWIGWRAVIQHNRTMIKGVTLVIMVLEALVVLIRQSTHFRVTRALRPIFLVDTRACGEVRRFIRQILQSLPPILDMLTLLLFLMSGYALLGFFLFGHVNNPYFKSLTTSFVSMFVLLTTANYPDVMMASYAVSKWYAVFFISYLSMALYVLMNLMLAVVSEVFTVMEKEKFRKLLLHKRRACQKAFHLLVSKQNRTHVRFRQFYGLMRYFVPQTSLRDVVLTFLQLNTSNSGKLSLEEFLNIYYAMRLRWSLTDPSDPLLVGSRPQLETMCSCARTVVKWRYFEPLVYLLVIGNGVVMSARIYLNEDRLIENAFELSGSWDTWIFLSLFGIEIVLKVLGHGWKNYSASGWNIFDLCVTCAAAVGALVLWAQPHFSVVVIFRPLRMIRFFKLRKRYRDIFGTVVLLFPLMLSTSVVMIVMYYFFAIIGIELFSQYDLRNCCVNSSVEEFYKYTENGTAGFSYYYLNSFSDILTAGVTLFELTVVNNWFITMEAFAIVANQYSRIYFMTFYLFTMVVLTIVVASILEAFRFRIQYKKQTSKKDEEKMLMEEVVVDWSKLEDVVQEAVLLEALQKDFVLGGLTSYTGRRPRTRIVLQRHMYYTEICQWMAEADQMENEELARAATQLIMR